MKHSENGNGARHLEEAGEHIRVSARKAEKIAREPGKIKKLLQSARQKLEELDTEKETFKTFLMQLSTFMRMLRAYANGAYPNLPWRSLTSIIAGILYFIMPLDLIPDYIPVAGFMDDMALLTWVYKSVSRDVEAFLDWEAGQALD
jgi:uncharacterized membrane protein YkvA (DUF1232 family)